MSSIFGGEGSPGDPYRYIMVECFAAETGEVKDTAHAKRIVCQ
jgi:hypothetical protein